MLDITSGANLIRRRDSVWGEQWRVDKLEELWAAGKTASEIGLVVGVSRCAVIGKARRLRLTSRKRNTMTMAQRLEKRDRAARRYYQKLKQRKDYQPKSRAPAPVVCIVDHDIPLEQRRAIWQLTAACCHWPVGEPESPDFFYCGSPDMRAGSSYCRTHHARAYHPPRTRERTSTTWRPWRGAHA